MIKSIFSKIGLVPRFATPELMHWVFELADYLLDKGCEIFIDDESGLGLVGYSVIERCNLGKMVDLVIVIGGDGTMLEVAYQIAPYRTPMVGVNRGRLGFLTDIPINDMISLVDEIVSGEFISESRLLIMGEICDDRSSARVSLNDIVFNTLNFGKMLELEVFIDGEFICSQRADGLIISTPTGSTAYSLAAGGAILHPGLEVLTLVPICPQSINNRPIVIPAESNVDIVISRGYGAVVHFDGQYSVQLESGDKVSISKYWNPSIFLHPKNYRYYGVLREKLFWGRGSC